MRLVGVICERDSGGREANYKRGGGRDRAERAMVNRCLKDRLTCICAWGRLTQ